MREFLSYSFGSTKVISFNLSNYYFTESFFTVSAGALVVSEPLAVSTAFFAVSIGALDESVPFGGSQAVKEAAIVKAKRLNLSEFFILLNLKS
ncbi:hypothetical protein [Mucilaginibacter celer]|uniref:hypothetical protein n=1 Tax=Mucilaginibacter celer TaxID=2305508 RepID=UPI0013CEAB73|nr:hypothetical protein [Mucilaginibacter celer]